VKTKTDHLHKTFDASEVLPHDDYTLTVLFDNGEKGILDMRPLLDFGVFQTLKDYDAFKRVHVAFDTIGW